MWRENDQQVARDSTAGKPGLAKRAASKEPKTADSNKQGSLTEIEEEEHSLEETSPIACMELQLP